MFSKLTCIDFAPIAAALASSPALNATVHFDDDGGVDFDTASLTRIEEGEGGLTLFYGENLIVSAPWPDAALIGFWLGADVPTMVDRCAALGDFGSEDIWFSAWRTEYQLGDRDVARRILLGLEPASPTITKRGPLRGVGDTVNYIGWLPDSVRVVECDRRLVGLLSRSFPGVEFVESAGGAGVDDATLWAYGVQRKAPWLIPARDLRGRYGHDRPVVGLSWRTCGYGAERRSLPLVEMLRPLAGLPVRWVSLQYGDHRSEIEAARAELGVDLIVDEEVDALADLDVFASQVAAMDAVMTIDNSTGHFAGALGVPVCVLLPVLPDWRWGIRDGVDTYPTMRLVHQKKANDWGQSLEEAKSFLAKCLEL